MKAAVIAITAMLSVPCARAGVDVAQAPHAASRGAVSTAPPAPTRQVLNGCNDFAWRLQRTLAARDPGANVFVSPLSIATALSMAWNGASGETASGMAATLGFAHLPHEAVNSVMSNMVRVLRQSSRGAQVQMANSLWLRAGDPFRPDFLARVRDNYAAELANVSFTAPATVPRINAWVSKATGGLIKNILQDDDLNSDTVAVLVNAIYFFGAWQQPFSKQATRAHIFTASTGARQQCQMMRNTDTYFYAEPEGHQMIRLPYKGGRLVMYVVLPATNSTLTAVLNRLDMARWRTWRGALRERDGTFGMPRLKFEYAALLNEPLIQLGMARAFDESAADFSRMRVPHKDMQNIWISKVLHKAWVEINEEGTTAAAATAGDCEEGEEEDPPPPFEMIVDRPYVAAICHERSGLILFLGAIARMP